MLVLFTARAERQLDRLHRYITEQSGDQRADDYVGRIVGFCRDLGMFPRRGAARDDLLPGLRTHGFERQAVIAFVVTADAVLIEGIFYGGQDFQTSFRE